MPRTGRKEAEMAEEAKNPAAPDGPEAHAEDTDWKAEARKWESRSKENKAAADELNRLKESQMSEVEKAKAEAEAAKAEAASLKAEKERESWVKKASVKTGVPADLLRGRTEEEIEAHAEALKPYAGKKTAPVVDLGKPSSEEQTSEKAEFARKLFGQE